MNAMGCMQRCGTFTLSLKDVILSFHVTQLHFKRQWMFAFQTATNVGKNEIGILYLCTFAYFLFASSKLLGWVWFFYASQENTGHP